MAIVIYFKPLYNRLCSVESTKYKIIMNIPEYLSTTNTHALRNHCYTNTINSYVELPHYKNFT